MSGNVVLAVDPGTTVSAYVLLHDRQLLKSGKLANDELLGLWPHGIPNCHLAVEMVASYGMPVGREVFETCVWIGRFIQAWRQMPYTMVYRREVKLYLCGSMRANDANVRQALLDKWGGKDVAMGNKRAPGPLYGVRSDIWSALAVAVTWQVGRN